MTSEHTPDIETAEALEKIGDAIQDAFGPFGNDGYPWPAWFRS